MNRITKKICSGITLATLIGMGYEVATHDFVTNHAQANKINFIDSAYAQNLDRGFADLVKRVIPGVVNISTYTHPKQNPAYGYRMGGQNELFQRFYEEFFGGRMPQPRLSPGQNMGPNGGGTEEMPEEDDDGGPLGNGQPVGPSHPHGGQGGGQSPKGKSIPVALGTGFVIDAAEGLILTNNHVVQGAEEVKVQFREDEPELIPAEIIGRDPELDVALLKVKSKTKLIAIPMGDSDAIDVGEYVLAIGNPLGYGHTVSHGILSAKGRRNPEFRMGRFLQTDASINPGNSGGPLINVKGEVIGINNAIDARAQGIGFAIPINLVKSVLKELKTKGSVSRGYLGVSAADLSEDIAQQLNINPKLRGVIVSDVQPGSPAETAGVRPYDVITSVNGEAVTNSSDLTIKISSVPVGQNAKVEIVRAGKPKSLLVKVSERPLAGGLVPRSGKKSDPKVSSFDQFGFRANDTMIEGQKAVIISDLAYGSPAANSGLNRGDIILDVAGKEIHTTTELEKTIKAVKGPSIMIRVKRTDQNGNEFVSVVVLSK
jgi:serine protease Do